MFSVIIKDRSLARQWILTASNQHFAPDNVYI